jgi:hypothetical protein
MFAIYDLGTKCHNLVQNLLWGRNLSFFYLAQSDHKRLSNAISNRSTYVGIISSKRGYSAGSPNDVSPNDGSPNDSSPNDVSPNDVSPNDVSPKCQFA